MILIEDTILFLYYQGIFFLLIFLDNNMDVRNEELKLNPEAGDFEHVYIKQEEQAAPSSTLMVIKNEDKLE
jgi:hypothetical protein